MKDFYQIMLVTNRNKIPLDQYLNFIDLCARSGITSIQLRDKNVSYSELFEIGKQIHIIAKKYSIPLIINDNLKLALELNAEGVHLGQSDGSIQEARAILGSDKILGLTVNSEDELKKSNNLKLDYVGIGAIFKTNSKCNIQNILGCDGLKRLSLISKHPIVAIGGINEYNANEVLNSGAHGIAAIEAFHTTKDITQTIKNFSESISRKLCQEQ